MIGNGKSVNPFLQQMYYHISFNTWLNYTRRNQKRERFYIKQEKQRNKCIEAGKPFYPVEFEEEKEQLQYVTIEVDDVVFYTSEEQSPDSSEEDPFGDTPGMQLKSSLVKKYTTRSGRK
jgi:hypothetical protein